MNLPELARLFYIEIAKIHEAENEVNTKIIELATLLNKVFFAFTKDENIQFTTMFARIAFACHKYQVSRAVQWRIHQLRQKRKLAQRENAEQLPEREYITSLKTMAFCVAAFCQTPVPTELRVIFESAEDDEADSQRLQIKGQIKQVRAFILDNLPKEEAFLAKIPDQPHELIRIRYNVTSVNEHLQTTVRYIIEDFRCRASVNLIDVLIDEDGKYMPKMIVLEPDYLVDVSSIAECFQGTTAAPLVYLLKKFQGFQNTKPLMLGNIANFFLDELMTDINADFQQTFLKVFNLNPIAFALFDDSQIRQIHQDSKKHFANLQRVLKQDFADKDIHIKDCYLEPSFYSETYGLQGRLDVWYRDFVHDKAAIVELKSGQPYMPNRFGISNNNYIQTLLYDLLVRSVFKEKVDPAKYILYSGLDVEHLKYAPTVRAQQDEAIKVRNEILVLEKRLALLDTRPLDQMGILDRITPSSIPTIKGFTQQDFQHFSEALTAASDLEQRYFRAFASFVAREHQLARTGVQGNDSLNGIASLWLNDFEQKNENFDILGYLEMLDNQAASEEPIITFKRTELTKDLANFREGDIVVLYPKLEEEDTALSNQIFKGSLYKIDSETVTMRLHSRQFNARLFEQDIYWFIEHDMMDKSYNVQYQALYTFLNSKKHFRELLLTTKAPEHTPLSKADELQYDNRFKLHNPELSVEQLGILRQALSSKNYFLLVGPPGTGKTKFMLAEMVRYLLKHSTEHILLLAYTNRAVDEICEAIHEFAKDDYIRIGSRATSNKEFRDQLFHIKTEGVKTRKELNEIIQKHRIFVSTIASIANNPLVLKIKKFDTAIIDEASQVLEPLLVGMLPAFQRFILIGDHKQLPAVVLQDKERSALQDEELAKIGLTNRRNSLFERLYQRAKDENWTWAHAMLSHQGRMHADICQFPSREFYANELKLLPEAEITENAGHWQRKTVDYQFNEETTDLEKLLAGKRVLYFPTPTEHNKNPKTNSFEADCIGEIVQAFYRLYQANGKEWTENTLGVITPYRAQIAQIRKKLSDYHSGFENCTIDTVERYQGGARDIILISLCLNMPYQLESLVSLSDDELVDRKLNVALTRARQHLVIVGNEGLMKSDERYKKLIDWIRKG